jgi:membrane protease YdiL (CAAX protease family)
VLPLKPWKPEAVLQLVLGVFICVSVGALLTALTRGVTGAGPGLTLGRVVAGVASFQGAALVLVWRFVREHGMDWNEAFGVACRPLRAILLGALVAALFFPAGRLLQLLSLELMIRLHLDPSTQSAVEALRAAGRGPGLMLFAALAVVIVPLAEELVFRGVLYPAIKGAGFPRTALWSTSILFAVIHFNLAIFLPLLALALALTWLYEKTANLLATIAAHGAFNALNLALFFLLEDPARILPGRT